jgi:hypothetical protein
MEAGIQVGADTIDHGDDRNRNTRCDQPVFDRRGGRIVPRKAREQVFMGIPWTDTWLPERIPGSGRTVRLLVNDYGLHRG